MFSNLIEKTSLKAKIKMGKAFLGLSSSESALLDEMACNIVDHPFAGALIPDEVRTAEDLVVHFSDGAGDTFAKYKGTISAALSDPAMRSNVARMAESLMPKDQNKRNELITVMMKVINSPIGHEVPDEYDDAHSMIEKGAIPLIVKYGKLDEDEAQEEPPHLVRCRYCQESFFV